MRRRAFCLLTVVFAVLMFGCDHATKVAASTSLAQHGPVSVVGDAVVLRYVRNDDVAFSLMHLFGISPTSWSPIVLAVAATVAMTILAFAWWRMRRGPRSRLVDIGFAMAFAGALGNVVDRVTHGYVVDFIHVKRWPVFNVADILVVIGMVLAVLGQRATKKVQE